MRNEEVNVENKSENYWQSKWNIVSPLPMCKFWNIVEPTAIMNKESVLIVV